jgi:adenine-specific DNA-methyltransferase
MNKAAMDRVTLQDGESANIVNENIEQLKSIFPEAFGEGGVNFETLRQLLGDAGVIDEGEEKYGLNWHGKKKARQMALTPSTGTLLPCPGESVNWETTKNLFIEGDNLEVLKLLQKSYAGKVKMIYIDPPYNTGKEFIYPDNYQENLDTYLKYTGQKNSEGLKFSSNTESSGRKHTNWLSMMYPRLLLARNLLSDEGVIFISIDENESANLRKICGEIFGDENYAGDIVWKNSSKNDQDYISIQHEYIFCFVKNKNVNRGIWKERKEGLDDIYKAFDGFRAKHGSDWKKIHEEALAWYKQFPESNPIYSSKHYSWMDEKGVYFPDNISGPNVGQYVYEVAHPTTKKNVKQPSRGWFCPEDKMKDLVAQNLVHFGSDETTVPCLKTHLKNTEFKSLSSIIYKDGRVASKRLRALFTENIFTNPKDVDLLTGLMKGVGVNNDDIVMDFFAGSGTVAHSVFNLNIEQNSDCRTILVQLPEDLNESKKYATGLSKKVIENAIKYLSGKKLPGNICEIGKERLRLVAEELKVSKGQFLGDLGFKVLKLANSNIRAWNPDRADLEKTLLSHQEHLIEGRMEQDILYELLLKRGVDLAVPIEIRNVSGKNIYSIGYGVLFACLDDAIAHADVENIAQEVLKWHEELSPSSDTHVFFSDSAFSDNVAKTNMVAILEQNGITHVRSL